MVVLWWFCRFLGLSLSSFPLLCSPPGSLPRKASGRFPPTRVFGEDVVADDCDIDFG